MNCLFGCKRKVISPVEKQVVGSKHWKSYGWFFPCTRRIFNGHDIQCVGYVCTGACVYFLDRSVWRDRYL